MRSDFVNLSTFVDFSKVDNFLEERFSYLSINKGDIFLSSFLLYFVNFVDLLFHFFLQFTFFTSLTLKKGRQSRQVRFFPWLLAISCRPAKSTKVDKSTKSRQIGGAHV